MCTVVCVFIYVFVYGHILCECMTMNVSRKVLCMDVYLCMNVYECKSVHVSIVWVSLVECVYVCMTCVCKCVFG